MIGLLSWIITIISAFALLSAAGLVAFRMFRDNVGEFFGSASGELDRATVEKMSRKRTLLIRIYSAACLVSIFGLAAVYMSL